MQANRCTKLATANECIETPAPKLSSKQKNGDGSLFNIQVGGEEGEAKGTGFTYSFIHLLWGCHRTRAIVFVDKGIVG